jgi:chromosomal replication initiation ATPase DnaA
MTQSYFSMWKGEIPTSRLQLAPMILEQVAWDHGMTVADLKSGSRQREFAFARFDAMTRLRAITNVDGQPRFSAPKIAQILGLKDHTSVLHGLKRWAAIQAEREAKAQVSRAAA